VVNMPGNTSSSVGCASAITPPTAPIVNDNCGRPLSVAGPAISGPDCGGSKVYVYTYTDCAGNNFTWTHTFNISPPNVNMPNGASSTVNCPTQATPPTPPSVNDNCGAALTITGPVVDPNPLCGGVKSYTWTYTDCANNTYTWVYTYNINAPAPGSPPPGGSSTVACVNQAVIPTSPDVNDSCGNPMTKTGPVISPDPICGGTKTYTWTYTPCSGQPSQWIYTYNISPPALPSMPAAGSSTVNCVADATLPTPPVISDNCGTTINPSGPSITPDPICSGTKTYTWTYTSCTGDSDTWSYVYTIQDPVISISCPNNISFCENLSGVYTISPAVASSSCGGIINMSFTITGATTRSGNGPDASGIFNPGLSTITWTTTNTCGNIATCITTVTITATPILTLISAICDPSLMTYTVIFNSTGGTISVTPVGNINSNTITNIPTGTNITIAADNGCTVTLPVTSPNCSCPTVPTPTGIGYSICTNQNITNFVANIASPFDVRWFNIQVGGTPIATGSTYTPTGAGTWYAEGFDPTTNCVSSTRTAFTLTINSLPNAQIIGPTTLCAGTNLELSVTGGVNYNWSGSGGTNPSATYTGLTAGTSTFTVTVTDVNGCQNTDIHTVVVSEQPTLSIGNVSCAPDLQTYGITITASGGTVTASAGAVSGNMITDIPISASSVTITVTNSSNSECIVSLPVSAPNCSCPTVPTPTGSGYSICNNQSITSFNASIVSPFVVRWFALQTGGTPIATGNTYTPTGAGTWYAEGFDPTANCASTTRTAFTLTINPLPNAQISGPLTLCTGTDLVLSATGGISYNWSGGGGTNPSAIYAGLTSGTSTYTVTVTDVNGCQNTATHTVVFSEQPTLSITNTSCAADLLTYAITFTAASGTVSASAGTISGNMITDINVATSSVIITVTNPANSACVVSLPVFAPNCNCPAVPLPTGTGYSICSNESITAFTSSIAAPFVVRWYNTQEGGTPIATGSTYTPSGAGTWYAEGYDPTTNCESFTRTPFVITIYPLPDITITGDTTVCKNTSTTLMASGGTTYSWSNAGGNQNSATYLNLQSTASYTVSVTSADGCIATKTVSVQVNELPSLNVSTACGQGENSGIITIEATPGSGGSLNYFLNDSPAGNITSISNLSNNDYTVKVIEQNSDCEADTTITINCGCPLITITGDSIMCQNGIITLNQNGSIAGTWSVIPSAAGEINTFGAFTAANNFVGKAEIRFTANGCVDKFNVSIINQIMAGVTGVSPLCFGENNGQIALNNVQGGQPQYVYLLNNNSVSFPVQNLGPGQYMIEVRDGIGCLFSETITLQNPAEWEITDITANKTIILPNEEVILKALVNLNQNDIKSISWTPVTGLTCPACLETSAKPTENTTYQVMVTDKNGCTAIKTINIDIEMIELVFPNIMNPKSAQGNNIFFVTGSKEIIEGINQMFIYDRWGNRVFSIENTAINDPMQGWDGKFGQVDVEPGVFIYYIKLKYKNGATKDFVGNITVIR
jgi:hypothetical protein